MKLLTDDEAALVLKALPWFHNATNDEGPPHYGPSATHLDIERLQRKLGRRDGRKLVIVLDIDESIDPRIVDADSLVDELLGERLPVWKIGERFETVDGCDEPIIGTYAAVEWMAL